MQKRCTLGVWQEELVSIKLKQIPRSTISNTVSPMMTLSSNRYYGNSKLECWTPYMQYAWALPFKITNWANSPMITRINVIPQEPLQANTSSIEVLSTSKDIYCIATLKGFQILCKCFRSQSHDDFWKYLACVFTCPPLVMHITKGSIQRLQIYITSKWTICSMTWICTSINTRWSVDPSRSLFEVYLENLVKDLQQLQELEAYINVQNQHLLLTKLMI